MRATIGQIAYHLPEAILNNEELEQLYDNFPAGKIFAKTGISERRIAAEDETASDLAAKAAEKLFAQDPQLKEQIDGILMCTQTPDFLLPTTACLLQERLGLSPDVAAFDINLGCSGFVYGLGIAKGMIETGQATKILLLTADTYSKLIDPEDRSVRSLFGDAAAATIVEATDSSEEFIGPFVYGTDGSGADQLITRIGGMRERIESEAGESKYPWLQMRGPEIFQFSIECVPDCVEKLEARAGIDRDDVDLFVFHQANGFMLEHLRQKLKIDHERFYVHMESCGNTVSSTIPIALLEAEKQGALRDGMKVMLVGFGVGLSLGCAMIQWNSNG